MTSDGGRRALRTFAELTAPTPEVETDLTGAKGEFIWQRYEALRVFQGKISPVAGMLPKGEIKDDDYRLVIDAEERLLGRAALAAGDGGLRVGWIWFSGTVTEGGKEVSYCFPAVSIRVERRRLGTLSNMTAPSISGVGDIEATDLISDAHDREGLLASVQFGGGALVENLTREFNWNYQPVDPRIIPRLDRLNAWIRSLARGLGFEVGPILAASQGSPLDTKDQPGITVHVGCGIYIDNPPMGTRQESLLRLAEADGLEHTALEQLYGNGDLPIPEEHAISALRPLSLSQRRLAQEAGGSAVSVISGAPGTGKSHVLSVLALDAVAQGQSVLVVAGSPHSVDVLVDHFEQTPGPTPVAFGGSRYGKQIARELAELVGRHSVSESSRVATGELTHLDQSAAHLLAVDREILRLEADPSRRLALLDALDRAGDLDECESMLESVSDGGVFNWFSNRKHTDALLARLGEESGQRARLDELRLFVDAQRLGAAGGVTVSTMLDRYADHEDAGARERGEALIDQWLSTMTTKHRRALTAISTALSLSRGRRASAIAKVPADDLVRAAPLWVGSVRDVDDVLPVRPGMFDLVIFDEASQIDQISAVNALVRAKRVIVCGDPHQLGHTSFISDEEIERATTAHGTDRDVLNVRDLSIYDVAATRVPTLTLDEHFRSAPHIIEFSGRRIYDGRIRVVTRTPDNEAADHIHVTHVEGCRNSSKVNTAEVTACLEVAESYIERGYRSIGFVSPFRPQADALEEAILDRYRLEEIDAYGLRVGTVHSFQGDERDVMIASWAIGKSEGTGPWRFVNQRRLFNVMITRARDQMHVVTSTPEPPELAGEYLRWSEPLTNLLHDVALDDRWVQRVAEALRHANLNVRVGYPVGRHLVDIVVVDPNGSIAVDCRPHVDGHQAHLDRALQLRRGGWKTADAYESRWADRLGELAIELGGQV